MGKILICSHEQDMEHISKNIIDFAQNGFCDTKEHIMCKTYKKLKVDSHNLYKQGDSFAVGVGTFIYDKRYIGLEALKRILDIFDDNFVFREKLIGSYCIAIYKDSNMYIFTDSLGTYNVYYYLSNDRFILTNTYYHVADTLGEELEVDEFGYLGNILFKTIAKSTPFKNINKLIGNNCIVIRGREAKVKSIEYKQQISSVSFVDTIKELYNNLPELFPSSGIFLTGGQDSRMCLGVMLAVGLKPKVYYGIGNSFLTCTKTEDLEIVKQLSQKYNLEMQIMNFNDSDNEEKQYYLQKYGEYIQLYGFNKNIMYEFEDRISSDFLGFGYFGETYRTVENIELYNKSTFTLDEYIDELYLDAKVIAAPYYEQFREAVYNQFLEICKYKKIDYLHLSKDDFQKLNTCYRQKYDTEMTNFANQFCYSFALLGEQILTDTAEHMSYDEKLNSKYQMKCLYSMNSALLNVPFFSHIKRRRLNRATFELTDANSVISFKERIRPYLKNAQLIKLARKLYYYMVSDHKGSKELTQDYAQISEAADRVSSSENKYGLDVNEYSKQGYRALLRFMIMDYITNSLKAHNNNHD